VLGMEGGGLSWTKFSVVENFDRVCDLVGNIEEKWRGRKEGHG